MSGDSMVFLASALVAHPVVSAVTAAVLVGGAGMTAGALWPQQDEVSVVRVIDGDTIVVERGGETLDVRLLNVDTPETKHPDKPVQCLGPEATDFLTRMLPAGTVVTLEFDEGRKDPHGRDLAGVFLQGTLVNAEIARAGFGAAKVYDGNDRFYPQVLQAQQEAMAGERGLYSPTIECTVPAQVTDLERKAQGAQPATAPPAELAVIDARQSELDGLLAEASALAALLAGDRAVFPLAALPDEYLASLRGRVSKAEGGLKGLSTANRDARAAEVQRQAQIQAEEARKAAEAAEAARQEVARQEAARQAQQREASGSRTSGSTSSGGAGAGTAAPAPAPAPAPAGDSYTGCRAYGSGGTSIDNKGRPYTKIDCVTKLPIG